MRIERWWKNGTLIRETIDGIEHTANIGIRHPAIADGLSLRQTLQPGALFSFVIKQITGANPCPHKCQERIAQMNQWGWWKCWRTRKTIAAWLAEEASKRGHQITERVALDLFKAAFQELRNRRRSPDSQAAGKHSAPPLQSP